VPTQNLSEAVSKINDFINHYPRNRYIISCRTAAYHYRADTFTNVIIAEFNNEQIKQFIFNWFQTDIDRQSNTAGKCWNALLEMEYVGAKELANTPLLLTFLCLVYDRLQSFPTNRSTLYRKALRILMEEWAAEKRIWQDAIYQELGTELEERLLSEIASDGFETGQIFFSRDELVRKINTILANNLNVSSQLNGEAILNAIVVQQGILVERIKDSYSFSHLTLQEYLTAQYISDHRGFKNLVSTHLLDRRWREVFLLVSGISPDGADELLLLMDNQAQLHVGNRFHRVSMLSEKRRFWNQGSNLQELLQWSDRFIAGSDGDYSTLVKRSKAISLALGLACTLGCFRDLVNASDRSRDLACALAGTSDSFHTFAHAIDRDLSCTRDLNRSRTHVISCAITLARDYEKIFQPQITDLIAQLEVLSLELPKALRPPEFVSRLYTMWLKALQLNPEILRLSQTEREGLENYLHACELMVLCKKSAVHVSPKTWSEIESRILRVP
jgi:hypothetical protein